MVKTRSLFFLMFFHYNQVAAQINLAVLGHMELDFNQLDLGIYRLNKEVAISKN